jgi:hypothetical protein
MVSENDDIFCNPIRWIAKNVIIFAYQQVPRPAAASGNITFVSGNAIVGFKNQSPYTAQFTPADFQTQFISDGIL